MRGSEKCSGRKRGEPLHALPTVQKVSHCMHVYCAAHYQSHFTLVLHISLPPSLHPLPLTLLHPTDTLSPDSRYSVLPDGSLRISVVDHRDQGSYQCRVSNPAGQQTRNIEVAGQMDHQFDTSCIGLIYSCTLLAVSNDTSPSEEPSPTSQGDCMDVNYIRAKLLKSQNWLYN